VSLLLLQVGFVLADRVLYLPSMGICLMGAKVFSSAFRRDLSKTKTKAKMVGVVMLIIIMAGIARTLLRNK
jgi:hypothetical protein